MKNSGFKAFTYSFTITLSAILAANHFFAPQSNEHQEMVISNKNIVLFVSKTQSEESKTYPIKKIALTTLPEIEKEEIKAPKNTLNNIEPPKPEDVVIMADNDDGFSYDYIPLDIEISPQEEVVEVADNQVAKTTFVTDAIDDTKKEIEPEKIITNKEVASLDIPEMPRFKIKEYKTETKELEVAQIEPTQEIEQEEDPALLIPLERGTTVALENKGLRVIHNGEDNQVASASKTAPISAIVSEEKSADSHIKIPDKEAEIWKSMEEIDNEKKNSDDSPWVATVGNKHAKNNLILESNTYKDDEEIKRILSPKIASTNTDELKLAAEMMDNLIIPIPEDIKNRKNLTPQLTSSEENKYIEQELDQELGVDREDDSQIVISDAQGQNIHKENKGGFFNSLTSIFQSSPDDKESINEENSDQGVIDSISRKIGLKRKGMQILPTEIRLSFQPNRAEISGTTLQWIQAFGKKAAEEETVALEIRLDANSSPALQHKRLSLLSNILSSRGVGGHKLRVVYTVREPNSFVIRTIRVKPKDKEKKAQYKNQNADAHYLQW